MSLIDTSNAIPNLRDVGGLRLTPTACIRRGILFRGAAPSPEPEDNAALAAALTDNKIKALYDLRSMIEINRIDGGSDKCQSILPNGVTRISAPVFRDQDYSPEANAVRFQAYADEDTVKGFTVAYKQILGAGQGTYSKLLKYLADPSGHPEPVMVHCTAGKDRTGVAVMLVLAICGADDESIAHEYGLTTEGLIEWRKKAASHLAQHPDFAGNPDKIERMLSSK